MPLVTATPHVHCSNLTAVRAAPRRLRYARSRFQTCAFATAAPRFGAGGLYCTGCTRSACRRDESMHVALLFPPATDPRSPHLALPSLAAALRAAGVRVSLHDLDLEGLLSVLQPENLAEAARSCRD